MAGGDAALVALPRGLHSKVLQGATQRIVSVVDQHVDVLVVLLRKLEAQVDMCPCIFVEHFKPGQASYDISAHAHRLFHKVAGTRVANQSLLGKGDYLNMDHVAPAFSQCQETFEWSQLSNGVYVCESAKDGCPVEDAFLNSPACSIEDILDGILCLVLPGQFEAFGKGVVLVGAHLVLEMALVQVDVSIDVGRHDQISASV